MTDIRSQAIALLVEKLREIEAEADRAWKQEDAWFAKAAERAVYTSTYEILDRANTRDLSYALAYRCQQLVEQIEAALLFEHLDEAEKLAENDELPRPGDRVKVAGKSSHYGGQGTVIAFGPLAHEVLLDKDRNGGSGAVRVFLPEDLIWLKPDGTENVVEVAR